MNLLLIIKDFLSKPSNQRNIVIILLIIAMFFWIDSCNSISDIKKIAEQNNKSLTEKLQKIENKNGELESVRKSLVSDISDLETLNSSLYKELEKERGNVKYIEKIDFKIIHDTVNINNEVITYPDDVFGLKWSNRNIGSDWERYIEGESKFTWDSVNAKPLAGKTIITDDIINFKIITGYREYEGYYETWAKTSYPWAEIDVESAIISKKPAGEFDRFHFGIYAGFGFGGYLSEMKFVDSPIYSIGIGFLYTPWSWCSF